MVEKHGPQPTIISTEQFCCKKRKIKSNSWTVFLWHIMAKVVFKPQLFFHSTFKVAVPDPKLNLKIGSAFSRVNEIKSTGPLHSDPKFRISFGYCW